VRVLQRLANIRTYAGLQLVKEYRLMYSTAAATGRSRIALVTECNGAGHCVAPTALTWSDASLTTQNFAVTGGHGAGDIWQMADLFGDGRQVYWKAHLASGQHYATRLNADASLQNFAWYGGHGFGDVWQMADLFGDGRQVYWKAHLASGQHYATRLNADGTLQNFGWSGGHGYGDRWRLGDILGEGRQLYWKSSNDGSHYATRLNSDGSLQNFAWSGGHGGGNRWQLADLFGEGRKLYWKTHDDGSHYATRLNPDGTLQNFAWNGGHGAGTRWEVADLFGDGREVYWKSDNDGTHYATRLNPDGTVENWVWSGGHGAGDVWALVDLFGDGRKVYWKAHLTEGSHYATRLNPDGSLQNFTWVNGHGWGDRWQMQDAFGEGRASYWKSFNDGSHYVTRFLSSAPDLLLGVDRGSGSVIALAYKAITDSTIYGKDTTSSYPIRDVQAALYVAASATIFDGIGGTRAQTYKYAGAKAHLQGHGFLGFRVHETTDVPTGLNNSVTFRQDWPYVGLPSLVKRTQSSGALLSEVSNSYSCTNPATGLACTVAAGNRYFPFVSQSVETGSDLNGAALPTLTTTTVYDTYGNATSVVVRTGDFIKTTSNVFTNDVPNWILGRLTRSTVQSTAP
jgi:hypothetical protein